MCGNKVFFLKKVDIDKIYKYDFLIEKRKPGVIQRRKASESLLGSSAAYKKELGQRNE